MAAEGAGVGAPDGVTPRHWAERGGLRAAAGPLSLAVLAILVVAGAIGAFGSPDQTRSHATPAAELWVFGPRRIRNGEFFEMRFRVIARQPIEEPVLSLDPGIWEDITINTLIPSPAEEGYERGAFRFTFDRLGAAEELQFKVDGQINPDFRGSNAGLIRLLDGDRELAAIRYDLSVLP